MLHSRRIELIEYKTSIIEHSYCYTSLTSSDESGNRSTDTCTDNSLSKNVIITHGKDASAQRLSDLGLWGAENE